MKIVVVGIGGIGGVIGGLMAKTMTADDELVFVARPGENHDALVERGLLLRTELDGDFTVRPTRTVASLVAVGFIADLVIVCVKVYSLDQIASGLSAVTGPATVVLPILNGVDTARKISRRLERGVILDGCTYITGVRVGPGVVDHPGTSRRILCGGPGDPARIAETTGKMVASGLEVVVREDIQAAVWSKYLMVCSFGVCTAYFDANVGQILADPKMLGTLVAVIEEIHRVSVKKNVGLPADCVERCLDDARKLNPANTSSLKRDLDKNDGSPTELALFSPYVCALGEELGVDTPTNRMLADALAEHWRRAGGGL